MLVLNRNDVLLDFSDLSRAWHHSIVHYSHTSAYTLMTLTEADGLY